MKTYTRYGHSSRGNCPLTVRHSESVLERCVRPCTIRIHTRVQGELDGGARSGNSTVEPSLAAAAVAVATAGSVSTDTDTDTDTDTGGKPCVVDGYSPRSVRSVSGN